MDKPVVEDKTFEKNYFAQKILSPVEYTSCVFITCDFTETGVSDSDFIDCTFKGCNISLMKVKNTGIKGVKFIDCKLTGVAFADCNDFLFEASFDSCRLDYSSFYNKKMKKTIFNSCSLKQVDFTQADLTLATFKNCDLSHAIFERSVLEKADFRTAANYCFDPELNKIKKAKFSLPEVAGLLRKYQIEIDEDWR